MRIQDSKISRFQDFKIFKIFKISRFQDFPYYATIQDFKISSFQDFKISRLISRFNLEDTKSNVDPPPPARLEWIDRGSLMGDPLGLGCGRRRHGPIDRKVRRRTAAASIGRLESIDRGSLRGDPLGLGGGRRHHGIVLTND